MLVNVINKSFFKIKKKNYGLGFSHIVSSSKLFGLPSSFRSNVPFGTSFNNINFGSNLLNCEKTLNNLVLLYPSRFNLGFYRKKLKFLKILKLNKSLRCVRHLQFLPVNGQRTKTNSRTQKSKKKKK